MLKQVKDLKLLSLTQLIVMLLLRLLMSLEGYISIFALRVIINNIIPSQHVEFEYIQTSKSNSEFDSELSLTSTTNFTLQVLHGSDFEGGIPAVTDVVGFSAVVNKLKDDPKYKTNTLILSSGDNYIPGAFFNASSDTKLNNVGGLGSSTTPVIGRGDIGILNGIGIQASALGNHEFDLGVRQVRDILRTGSGNPGTNFPYLSTNLDFSPEITAGNLSATDLAPNQNTAHASSIKGKIAKSTIINVAGIDGITGTADDQRIGIVGATTPTLANISSSGSTIVKPANPIDYDALAAEIQTSVDILKAQGINKIILLAHMQQLTIERDELAKRLRDKVDTALTLAPGKFTFALPGTEQDVLAEYLGDRFSTNAYGVADVSPALDRRIQNLTFQGEREKYKCFDKRSLWSRVIVKRLR
ncbi:hypothetical protein [Cylindrospermopsis sp. CR12]|uniref:hypothetical protein n=1 Tax=Cylindrospermopsis sp. CR12 TaxID=1747196 RepID=UPI00070894DD|nr:hypothetical protein [Cylindrospermopsis sp. CR12]KRH95609.1 hypothetical protein ASL19_10790 [Cylindrospermopsis sp. CR12]